MLQRDPTARVGRDVRFDLGPGATVTLAAGVVVGDGCRFHVRGTVVVGAGSVLGERCVVTAENEVVIGERCRLGDEVALIDAAPRIDDPERPVRLQGLDATPVRIGDDVVIGVGAAVTAGATIGSGAVIGPRTVIGDSVAAGEHRLGGAPPPPA